LKKRYVINTNDVEGFSIPGDEDIYVSKLLIDKESVGSKRISMSYFMLKPGKKTEPGIHPCPFDEVYFIVKGKGIVYLGEDSEEYEISTDSVVFIPCGLKHGLKNTGDSNLELLGIFPYQFKNGVNGIYDERIKSWGKSFKFIKDDV